MSWGPSCSRTPRPKRRDRLVMQAAEQLRVPLTSEIAMPCSRPSPPTPAGSDSRRPLPARIERLPNCWTRAFGRKSSYNQLYEQDTVGRVRLRGVILARVVSELDGRLAHTYVLSEDFERTGALPSDTEDVINMTLAIAGTEFAVIFVEQASGGFKLSFPQPLCPGLQPGRRAVRRRRPQSGCRRLRPRHAVRSTAPSAGLPPRRHAVNVSELAPPVPPRSRSTSSSSVVLPRHRWAPQWSIL
jgi:hypothetical protein